jgi:hypothetical protein
VVPNEQADALEERHQERHANSSGKTVFFDREFVEAGAIKVALDMEPRRSLYGKVIER